MPHRTKVAVDPLDQCLASVSQLTTHREDGHRRPVVHRLIKSYRLASAHGGRRGGPSDCARAPARQGCWVHTFGRGAKMGGAHETIPQSHHLAKTGWSAARLGMRTGTTVTTATCPACAVRTARPKPSRERPDREYDRPAVT